MAVIYLIVSLIHYRRLYSVVDTLFITLNVALKKKSNNNGTRYVCVAINFSNNFYPSQQLQYINQYRHVYHR